MPVATHVSVEEYLRTSYRPDCDYLEGVVVERNVGEYPHSHLQGEFILAFYPYRSKLRVRAVSEQRVQVKPDRYRVPDVCLIYEQDIERIFRKPPLLCIEILSPDDRMSEMQERIQDYLDFGVPMVWVVDPERRVAYEATRERLTPSADGILHLADPPITLDLAPLWPPRL